MTDGSKIEEDKTVCKIKLVISYGTEQEVRRVRNTIKKFPWYLEQGYREEYIKLPQGITKDSSDEDVERAVNHEYSDADYVECATGLRQEWEVVSVGFGKMREELSFHLGSEYGVVLTKYGMGGSYDTDASRVIVRINTKFQGGTAGTVVHEIVHMTIQYLIDHYHIRHWYKERLVDLLMGCYFPGLQKMQMEREDISMVDEAFKKSFPDMKAVIEKLSP